jgi:hypothetical protein
VLTRTFQHQCEALCVRLFRVVLQTSVPHCTDKAVVVAHAEPISSSCDWPRHWESLPLKALHTEWNPKMSRSLNPGFRCDCINRPQNFRIARNFLFQKLPSITIWQGSITTHSHKPHPGLHKWQMNQSWVPGYPLQLKLTQWTLSLTGPLLQSHSTWCNHRWVVFLFSPLKVVSPVRYKRCLFLVL